MLTVWKLDRLGRSLHDLIALLDDLKVRDVAFRSLAEAIDATMPTGRAMWQIPALKLHRLHQTGNIRLSCGTLAGHCQPKNGNNRSTAYNLDFGQNAVSLTYAVMSWFDVQLNLINQF